MPTVSPSPAPLSLFDGRCCTLCGVWKPWAEMEPINTYRCRACKRQMDREYYARNREKVLATVKAYAAANPEKIRARNQSPQQKEALRAYEQRPDVKAMRAAYRQTEVGRDVQRRGQKKHHQTEVWKIRNRLNQHRRRVAGKLTPAEWFSILLAYDYRCAYCGEPGEDFQLDHVLPISRGGLTELENIVPACETCNKRKQDFLWEPRAPVP